MAIKSITLKAGECVVLPKDAVVQSIIINGSISPSSTCTDLPDPTTYKCGVFYFFIDETGTDDSAMEEEHVRYSKLTVGSNIYIIDELAEPATIGVLNAHVTDTALFQFMSIQKNVLSDRQLVAVYFQTPEEFFDDAILQISDRGTVYNLPANEATCEEYPEPE